MRIRIFLPIILLCLWASVMEMQAAPRQGPIRGAQIAVIQSLTGDVFVSRAATPANYVKIATNPANGFGLANGDRVKTVRGQAEVRFTDNSIISLRQGTEVAITERPAAGGVQRTIQQFIGSLWFSIQRSTGTSTNLQTPTAVAAIRGTEGTQDVPGPDESTHALNEGVEQITESVTRQSVTIHAGQRVTAIRGVGFTPVVALLGLIARPVFAGSGGGGAGGGTAGAGTGAAGGATGASAATAATASSVSSIAATAASVVISTATAIAVPFAAQNSAPQQSVTQPLSPPGGNVVLAKTAGASVIVGSPTVANGFMSNFGGTIPLTAASGSMWAVGALTHNQKAARTGLLATQAVQYATEAAGGISLFERHGTGINASDFIGGGHSSSSGNAVRTFAFASVISHQYSNKPLVVIGSYGFAAAVSLSRMNGPRHPADMLIGAAIGEVIGRILTRHHAQEQQ